MPPRESELPEGTDHIINGAMETRSGHNDGRGGTNGGGGSDAGFVGGGLDDDTGGTMTSEYDGSAKGQFREGFATLKQEATDRARQFADEGKGRASDVLDEVSRIVEEAADSIDQSIGNQYGSYARSAAHAVSGFSTTLRAREVDELYGDAREFVRKSPVLAIGAAAAIGFAFVRLVKAGLPQDIEAVETEAGDAKASDGKTGSKSKKRSGAED
jgi:ElaB/YqjD/DUF883 family membrane-anchored ribosome-binding protein